MIVNTVIGLKYILNKLLKLEYHIINKKKKIKVLQIIPKYQYNQLIAKLSLSINVSEKLCSFNIALTSKLSDGRS